MEITLESYTPDPLKLIYAQTRMTAAQGNFRDFFLKEVSIDRQLQVVRGALNSNHWSVSRGVTFTFNISGISRATSLQLVRSVVGVSVEQQSQRYSTVDTTKDWYIIPPDIANNELAFEAYTQAMFECATEYNNLIELGINKEDARMVLPNATRTNLVMTFSFEALKNFLGTRLCTRSMWEIRQLAKAMRKEVIKVVPWAGEFLGIKCTPLGICTEANTKSQEFPKGCPLLKECGGKIEWRPL